MSLASITAQATLILQDHGETFQTRVLGDGDTTRFTLARDNVELSSVIVEHPSGPPTVLTPSDGTPASGEYQLDARGGVVTVGLPPALGDELVIEGRAFVASLPSDLASFIDTAYELHTAGRYPRPTIDELSPTEGYLVALLAVIENLWSQATEASGEIDVMTPEGVNIPASQRFAQILTLIGQLTEHYKELAQAFNVGPYRIVVSTLRRISRTTNRLVPIYLPQEFDDRSYPPVRIYPPIDTGLIDIDE